LRGEMMEGEGEMITGRETGIGEIIIITGIIIGIIEKREEEEMMEGTETEMEEEIETGETEGIEISGEEIRAEARETKIDFRVSRF